MVDYMYVIKSSAMSTLNQRCSSTVGAEPCHATIVGNAVVKAVDRSTGIEYTLSAGHIGNQAQFQVMFSTWANQA
jgi:hypothetical protein